ncbi:MAG TPA: polysaccharide deacetylase family protein [Allosphingosinicella sp.]|nr:polysaccharide deacetylase family protein [Allosphingosinicella sp.]
MGLTYILHGCVEGWNAASQAMRMYAPEENLRRHLARRQSPYADPDENGDGDVLTVDDSTRGGARACLVAREMGHSVTLFLNPSQIVSGRDYWFSRFDSLVDARQAETVRYRGRTYDLRSRAGLRAFRWAARDEMVTGEEELVHRLLDDLGILLSANDARVPDFAQTIGLEDVRVLNEAGVRFGNHGWDHQCISSLSPERQLAQLGDTRDWLSATTGQAPRDYAVPYGQARLDPRARAAVPGTAYLVSPIMSPYGPAADYVCRHNLTAELQDEAGP